MEKKAQKTTQTSLFRARFILLARKAYVLEPRDEYSWKRGYSIKVHVAVAVEKRENVSLRHIMYIEHLLTASCNVNCVCPTEINCFVQSIAPAAEQTLCFFYRASVHECSAARLVPFPTRVMSTCQAYSLTTGILSTSSNTYLVSLNRALVSTGSPRLALVSGPMAGHTIHAPTSASGTTNPALQSRVRRCARYIGGSNTRVESRCTEGKRGEWGG